MYKIYINDTPIRFVEASSRENIPFQSNERNLVARYAGSKKNLLNYADMLEKTNRFDSVTLYTTDLPALKEDFLQLFTLIEAAGGIVRTPEGKVLLIHRLGHWDLPKGKIDPGESPEQAAIREVEEETGLKGLTGISPFDVTYHTYRTGKNKRLVKRTYWFLMSAPEQPLSPQTEEDILAAEWHFPEHCLDNPEYKFYRSIEDLLKKSRQNQDRDHSSSSGLKE